METLRIGDIVCRVRRSGRKSIAVRVCAGGEAEVLAPYGISADDILRMTEKYKQKIAAECLKRKEFEAERQKFCISYGDTVRLLGTERVLCPADDKQSCIDGDFVYVPSGLSEEFIRSAVIQEYKRLAAEYIPVRVRVLSEMMGLTPEAVKINSARSHWASCSRKSSLNFSWCCIMAEPRALDYIIVHELSHMIHFNHSAEFWAEVGKYVPDYKEHRSYLKNLWRTIMKEKWF